MRRSLATARSNAWSYPPFPLYPMLDRARRPACATVPEKKPLGAVLLISVMDQGRPRRFAVPLGNRS